MARSVHSGGFGGAPMPILALALAGATMVQGGGGPRKLVAWDGIEPPTRGFSDPCSTQSSPPVSPIPAKRAHSEDTPPPVSPVFSMALAGASMAHPPRNPRPLAAAPPIEPVVLSLSVPDSSGRASAEWGPGPQVLYLGQDQTVNDYLLVLPIQATVCEIRSFIGWDSFSVGEAGLDVSARGARIYERSDHKESPRDYDAWSAARIARRDLVAGDEIQVQTRASQTAPRTMDQGRSTRVEFALRLTLSLTGRCE